jgi:hypothetical protein
MKMTGKEFIEKVCERLRDEDVRLYDSNIKNKIESLTANELSELVSLGDIALWKTQRNKLRSEKPLTSDMDWQDQYSDPHNIY